MFIIYIINSKTYYFISIFFLFDIVIYNCINDLLMRKWIPVFDVLLKLIQVLVLQLS